MIVQNNISAINTFRNMAANVKETAKSNEKLSSGRRINRSADDAAGLAIREKMRAQVNGLGRASANSQDGISLIQSADGALSEVHSILHRMRELSTQAANDINEQVDRQAIQDEVDQLVREIDRIAFTTEFNKMTILDGSLSNGKYIKSISGSNISGLTLNNPFQAVNGLTTISLEGGQKFDTIFNFEFPRNNAPYTINNIVQEEGQTVLGINISADIALAAGIDTSGMPNAPAAFYAVSVNAGETAEIIAGNVSSMIQAALGKDWSVTATGANMTITHKFVGEFSEGIQITADPVDFWEPGGGWDTTGPTDNITGTQGKDIIVRIDDGVADFSRVNTSAWENEPEEGGLRGRDTLLNLVLGDGTDEFVHREQFTFKIDDATISTGAIIATQTGRELALQVGANVGYLQSARIGISSLNATSLGISALNMFSHENAQLALSAIDIASQLVSDQRAALGAIQNRLEHTIANLDTVAENLLQAESRISDADMAKEMMGFTKYSILTQASQAMMAQANNLPQGVLQMLR